MSTERTSEGVRSLLRQVRSAAAAAAPSRLAGWVEKLLDGDRRGSLRLNDVPGRLRIGASDCALVDLSRAGAHVEGYDGPLKAGDLFGFVLSAVSAEDGNTLDLSANATVAWRNRDRLGCCFAGLTEADRERLDDFLDRVIAARLEQVETVLL